MRNGVSFLSDIFYFLMLSSDRMSPKSRPNCFINFIYHSDVPLVQAKHHYEKINDDDLELAEGEICRVLKKYTDGNWRIHKSYK